MVMMRASGFFTGSLQPFLDTQLGRNYADAKQYGKIPFMYHYFVPAVSAVVQAAWFLRAVAPLTVGDGYAVDVEIDGPNLVQDVLTFVTDHHANTGCYPWVYIDRYLRQKYNWSPVFALCSEWIAAPDVSFNVDIPNVGVYVAQQGPIVNGVDTDEYFGSLESLKSYTYGYHAPVATPTVVATPEPAQTVTTTPVVTTPAPEVATVIVTTKSSPSATSEPTQTVVETKTTPVVVTTSSLDNKNTTFTQTSMQKPQKTIAHRSWWTIIWDWWTIIRDWIKKL
jgi:cell division septation protein DedD